MKQIGLRESQMLQLDILLALADHCQTHGLTYYIAYGTLLGAVRHQGFIPWDDDIDVWMPREDYNRLIESFNTAVKVPYYRLIAPMDAISRHSFVKIIDTRTVKIETNFDYAPGALGVDIDVFPLDGQPEDADTYRKWFAKLEKCYQKADFPMRLSHECRRKRYLLALINLFGGKRHRMGTWIKRHYLKKAQRLHGKYPVHGSKYIGVAEHCFSCENERYEARCFEKIVRLPFEGHLFQAPAELDAVLRQTYDDYWALPPEPQRFGHFVDQVFWK